MTVKERLAALAAEVEVYLRERFGVRMRERGVCRRICFPPWNIPCWPEANGCGRSFA